MDVILLIVFIEINRVFCITFNENAPITFNFLGFKCN